MNFGKETLLVIAPHADDEILGCYGLMKKIKKNGGKVFVQILTMGGYSRNNDTVKKEIWKNEFLNVSRLMKIDGFDIAFNENEEKHLDTVPQHSLIEYITSKSKTSLLKIKPSMIAIPTIFSTHQDHVQAYKISLASLRARPQKTSVCPKMVLSYESPEYHFWSAYSEFGQFSPNFFIELNKVEINDKVKMFRLYKSQFRKNQRDGEKIISLAKIRGNEIGANYAESYHIHRMTIK